MTESIPSDVLDILQQLLQPEPTQRMKMTELTRHPWLFAKPVQHREDKAGQKRRLCLGRAATIIAKFFQRFFGIFHFFSLFILCCKYSIPFKETKDELVIITNNNSISLVISKQITLTNGNKKFLVNNFKNQPLMSLEQNNEGKIGNRKLFKNDNSSFESKSLFPLMVLRFKKVYPFRIHFQCLKNTLIIYVKTN